MLSLLDNNMELENEYDFLILNSTAFIEKAKKISDGYDTIELYLDNDITGNKMTAILMEHSKNCIDRSNQYKDCKDINEQKMGSTD